MYIIEREVGNSHVGADGKLTLGAAIDFMQDCCGFQLDSEQRLTEYFQENRITMFLISRQVNLHRPVEYGEKIRIVTTIYQLKNSYGFRNTNICDESGTVVISSYAGGAFIDLNQMKATSIPKEIVETVPMDDKFQGMEYLPRKIHLPADPKEDGAELSIGEGIKVCRYHIDRNRHMNNSCYVEIAEEFLPDDFRPATARIEYKTAAKYGDLLIPHIYHMEEGRRIVSLQDEQGIVFANVEFRSQPCAKDFFAVG